MREIFQCIFCASIGFITASLLAAGKYRSSETGIDNSTTNAEVPANVLSEIPKGT
jgi:hypothetical protein